MEHSNRNRYFRVLIISCGIYFLRTRLSTVAGIQVFEGGRDKYTKYIRAGDDESRINHSKKLSGFDRAPIFRRKSETKHISCGRVLAGDEMYIKNITLKRIKLQNRELNMSCSEIKARILPPKGLKNLMFGVAYARIVYENYEFIEDEIRSSFHPQNLFCFSVDSKAQDDLYSKLVALSICLPNVLIPSTRYPVSGGGYNMNRAHYDCLKLLSKYEESQATAKQLAASLTMVREMVQSSISRAAVDWAVNTVDLTALINQINTCKYGTDELLWAALQMTDDLQMPGRFTGECKHSRVQCITRAAFSYRRHSHIIRCPMYRHTFCIFGIENLQFLSASKSLMANKPYPAFDYAIVDCMHELLFNRTHLNQIDHKMDLQFYSSLENVRYHTNSLNPDPNYKLHCPSRGR